MDGTRELLERWEADWRVRRSHHERQARVSRRWHWAISIPATLLPVATAPIVEFQSRLPNCFEAIMIVSCVTSTLLNTLHTTLRLQVAAQQHERAAADYADLLTDAEELEVTVISKAEREDMVSALRALKTKYDATVKNSPTVASDSLAAESEDCCLLV